MNQLYPIVRRVRRPLLPPDNQVKEVLPAKDAEPEATPLVKLDEAFAKAAVKKKSTDAVECVPTKNGAKRS